MNSLQGIVVLLFILFSIDVLATLTLAFIFANFYRDFKRLLTRSLNNINRRLEHLHERISKLEANRPQAARIEP